MPTQPLLSFSIFTYNRVFLLSQLLDQLVEVKNAFPDGVIEVVISDNASTDGTAQMVCERYGAQGFRLIVQEKNIGITQNWLRVIQESSGIYVWPYADDDLIDVPAVIEMVSSHLQQGTADFYHVNYAQGIYTDKPRRSAKMGQIYHCVEQDMFFPDLASLIPYSGIALRGIMLLNNVFRGDAIRGQDFSEAFSLSDVIENSEVIMGAFKHKKCALLQACCMIHLHPPEPRWFQDIKKELPGRYALSIGLMRRVLHMIGNGTIAPQMIGDDGFVWVEKKEGRYLTLRKKLAHMIYPDVLNVIKAIGQPLDPADGEVIEAFAGHIDNPSLQLAYRGLRAYADTLDPALYDRLEKLRPQIEGSGMLVMAQADQCPAYEAYMGKEMDLSRMGALELAA